jgi:hypothetical protein
MSNTFRKKESKGGYILILAIVIGSIAIYFIGGLTNWAVTDLRASSRIYEREQSIHIAESGIDYYRWHLAHSPTDFQDGTGAPGPYHHEFLDKNGTVIGHYSLSITPPPLGSTLVTVESTASTTASTSVERSVAVQLAKPSIAQYAVAANDAMRFGAGTIVYGPIHSNGGIRFDGTAFNVVSSAVASYDDPDHNESGVDPLEYGVHTHVSPTDPLPPTAVPQRVDVFRAGREFPLPAIDFVGITADLAQMKTDAQSADGFYRGASGGVGYRVVLKTDDTFDLYQVTSRTSPGGSCTAQPSQNGWGTWTVQNSTLLGSYAFPVNGIIFLEDDVFVNGQVNGARVTIIAAVLPDNAATRKSITINNDLLYTNYDGSDVVGLIAQNNINVGFGSEDDLRIDGALIAQNGRVGRYYYVSGCGTGYLRSTITLWGMIATSQRYGFAYVSGPAHVSGYSTRNLNYDGSLLYGPPPSFPLTGDEYVTLTWQEGG